MWPVQCSVQQDMTSCSLDVMPLLINLKTAVAFFVVAAHWLLILNLPPMPQVFVHTRCYLMDSWIIWNSSKKSSFRHSVLDQLFSLICHARMHQDYGFTVSCITASFDKKKSQYFLIWRRNPILRLQTAEARLTGFPRFSRTLYVACGLHTSPSSAHSHS